MATTPITDTGIRGFLKWFKQQQPGIYQKIAPVLPQKVPQAFSGFHQGGWKVAGLSRDAAVERLNGMSAIYAGSYKNRVGMSDLAAYDGYTSYSAVSGDQGQGGTYYTAAPIATDLSSATAADVNLPSSSVDVATAANNGSTASTVASAIGSVINTASQAYLTAQEANTQASIINTQLQRAQSGLAPLTTSLSSLGIPTIGASSTGVSSGGLILIGGAALLLILMAGK